ncbi:hypothetical protein ACTXG5_15925 [Mycobacterium sp. Dal123C01]|uniref:hypothetical protein n=1 Tax=Mycobacterium sp. Dal123C01 TaxID=3457577 RepID=UPI00403EE9D1
MRLATSVALKHIRFELHGTIDHHQHDRFCQPVIQHGRFAGGDQQHAGMHWIIDLPASPAGCRGQSRVLLLRWLAGQFSWNRDRNMVFP